VPVIRPKAIETTALGAAYAAGLAVGYWQGLDDLKSNWGVARRWVPQVNENTRARLYGSWKKAVDHSLGWIEPK
jgi:glycerol kinase